ncbi:MAG: bacterioferritin [Planctomycetes bacterium]|nr:bacterioferritin [Planctomycetota bacterium]
MKGNAEIIEILNEVLTAELTAVNQYFIHAKMCADWGYNDLAKYTKAESIDEMRHAEQVIDRILFLEGVPNMQRYFKIQVGATVEEQFKNDVDLEYKAVERLNRGVQLCVAKGDNTTRQILEKILSEEEHHVDWLETQLSVIAQVGIENYLSQKLGATDEGGH